MTSPCKAIRPCISQQIAHVKHSDVPGKFSKAKKAQNPLSLGRLETSRQQWAITSSSGGIRTSARIGYNLIKVPLSGEISRGSELSCLKTVSTANGFSLILQLALTY